MVDFPDEWVVASCRTGKRIADVFVWYELAFHEPRLAVLSEAWQTGNMTSSAGKHQDRFTDISASQTRNVAYIDLDEVERGREILLTTGCMFGTLKIELGKRRSSGRRIIYAWFRVVFTVTLDSPWFQHIVPVLRITIDGERSTLADSATNP